MFQPKSILPRAAAPAIFSLVLLAPVLSQAAPGQGVRAKLAPEIQYLCHSDGYQPSGYPSCSDKIPIVVVWEDGKCKALPPYGTLKVFTHEQETKVKWTLVAPPGYVFAKADGIAFVENNQPPKSTDIYVDRLRQDDTTYVVKIKKILKNTTLDNQTFHFAPNVVDPGGNPCEPIDPLIANTSQ